MCFEDLHGTYSTEYFHICVNYVNIFICQWLRMTYAYAYDFIVCSTVYSGVHKKSKLCYWPFVRETTGDRWIPLTKGQYRGWRHHDNSHSPVYYHHCSCRRYIYIGPSRLPPLGPSYGWFVSRSYHSCGDYVGETRDQPTSTVTTLNDPRTSKSGHEETKRNGIICLKKIHKWLFKYKFKYFSLP